VQSTAIVPDASKVQLPPRTVPEEMFTFKARTYFSSDTDTRYPNTHGVHLAEFKVTMTVHADDLGMSRSQLSLLAALAGRRFNERTNVLKLTTTLFPSRVENKKYLVYLLEQLKAESIKLDREAGGSDADTSSSSRSSSRSSSSGASSGNSAQPALSAAVSVNELQSATQEQADAADAVAEQLEAALAGSSDAAEHAAGDDTAVKVSELEAQAAEQIDDASDIAELDKIVVAACESIEAAAADSSQPPAKS
jgi:Mitochondrial ribosomal subunit protein